MSLFDILGPCQDPDCTYCRSKTGEEIDVVAEIAAGLPGKSFEEGLPGAILVIVSLLSAHSSRIDSLKAEIEKLKVQLANGD